MLNRFFMIFTALLTAFLLTTNAAPARAQSCSQVHIGAASAAEIRQSIVHFLRENPDIPAFMKKTPAGDVPVILMNATTYKKLKPLISQSAGFMFAQQIDANNDHGLMRVGENIIDADTPGIRGFGEFHKTGLSWKNMGSYLPRRSANSYVLIETANVLTKADYDIIDYYQRVRRAAIFRIPFRFGDAEIQDYPNTIENSGENCFGFCKGSAVASNVPDIQRRLTQMGVTDVHALIAKPEVMEFLKHSMATILKANSNDNDALKWGMLNDKAALKKLNDVIPKDLSEEKKRIFVNWIIALDASQKYLAFQKKYQVSSDGGYHDLNNGQTSFVLIYDTMEKAKSFTNGTYQSPGVFYHWRNENQTPL